MSKNVTIYSYSRCSTCREALRFLKTQDIPYTVQEVTETPPSAGQLKTALKYFGGDIRKLFNTSGVQYRELGIAEKLKTKSLSDGEALALLAKNGKLIKRPFVLFEVKGETQVLVGFRAEEWKKALAGSKG